MEARIACNMAALGPVCLKPGRPLSPAPPPPSSHSAHTCLDGKRGEEGGGWEEEVVEEEEDIRLVRRWRRWMKRSGGGEEGIRHVLEYLRRGREAGMKRDEENIRTFDLRHAVRQRHVTPGPSSSGSADASNIAIGGVLLCFFSRKLLKAESNSSTFDLEFLAVHQAIRHFRHFLKDITFTIQTNHMPLLYAASAVISPPSLNSVAPFDTCRQEESGRQRPFQSPHRLSTARAQLQPTRQGAAAGP
ncbi:hypothetical protein O3P69_003321 [Scylla paramamosain]|uniref:Reverse transcriptase RNase H-like domain-containing protein n=1 Tax=Scylla paramamosain TaxID=85552 RepID=A0AAW0UNL9_SCYPA